MKTMTLLMAMASLISANAFANDSNPTNTNGYFVKVLSAASNGGQAILGDSANPHLQTLTCEGAFQAENFFTVICSSGAQPEDLNADIHFIIDNIFSESAPGQLTLQVNGAPITLTCTSPDANNPAQGAVCR